MKFDQIVQDLETTLTVMESDRPEFSPDLEGIVRALGNVHFQMGAYAKSLKHRKRLLSIASAKADKELIGQTSLALFATAMKANEHQLALEVYRRVRAGYLPEDTMEQARLHLDAASCFVALGNFDQAILLYHGVDGLMDSLPVSEGISIRLSVWQNLIRVYQSNEVYDLALDAANKLLSTMKLHFGNDHGALIPFLDKVIVLHKKVEPGFDSSELDKDRRRLKSLLDG